MIALAIGLIGLGVAAYIVGLAVRFVVEHGRTRRRVMTLANIARLERELGITGAEPQSFEELLVESMTQPIVSGTASVVPMLVRNGLITAGVGARMVATENMHALAERRFGDGPVTGCPEPGGLPAAIA